MFKNHNRQVFFSLQSLFANDEGSLVPKSMNK